MKLHGRYKGNIIDFLSGTTKGNDILRNLIQNNPELSRLALGHTYAEKPGNLLKPNAINVPYINANPEISNLLRLQRQAHGQLENANQNAQLYKQVENIPQLSKEIEEQKKIIQRLKDEEEATGLSKQAMINKKYERDLAERKMKKLRNKLISTSAIGTALGYGIKKIRE
jgi:hypothetical protein